MAIATLRAGGASLSTRAAQRTTQVRDLPPPIPARAHTRPPSVPTHVNRTVPGQPAAFTISPLHYLTPYHLTTSPPHHLTTSPPHHLTNSAPHHLPSSPSSPHLTISPPHHLTTSPPHHFTRRSQRASNLVLARLLRGEVAPGLQYRDEIFSTTWAMPCFPKHSFGKDRAPPAGRVTLAPGVRSAGRCRVKTEKDPGHHVYMYTFISFLD